MESIPLEMDDIFEEEDVEDFSPSRLPDLEDELEPMRNFQNDDDREEAEKAEEETDNAELLAKLKNMKGASKNATRKTLPKLDATRLTGERGIPILPKVFKDIPLKGKNHEKEDLKIIMQTLEHWAHRLFPKMVFTDVLERVERLGAKKDVQSCVKRIRLDMPVLGSDSVQDDDEGDDTQGDDDAQGTASEAKDDSVQRNDESFRENEIDEDEVEELLREQMLPVHTLSRPDDAASQTQVQTKTGLKNGITDELKARIEQNKKLALERRAAKLAKTNEAPVTLLTQPSSLNTKVKSSSSGEQSTARVSTESQSDSMAITKIVNDSEISALSDSDVTTNSRKEQIDIDEPAAALQSDVLFPEDSDSELLQMIEDDF